MKLLILTSGLFLGLLIAPSVWSQESGRLPDGTAFRKTSDGFEVSDYIAELEVTNQELHSRLVKVESELAKTRLREKNNSEISENSLDSDLQNECESKLIEVSELVRRQGILINEQEQKIQQFETNSAGVAQTTLPNNTTALPEAKGLTPTELSAVANTNTANANANESAQDLFKSIKALQQQRFKMYKEYNELRDRKGKTDVFKPEELVAASGRNLQVLQTRSKNMKTAQEEIALVRDLNDIRAKLQQDLAELNALKKMLSQT